MRRSWRFVVAVPVLALVVGAGADPSYASARRIAPPARAFSATVERVVDGDTFIAVRHGVQVRVRLIGIDAPESVKPNWPVECGALEASRLLTRLLPVGTRVRAAYQPGGRVDQYGRDLWDVWLPGGAFLQAVLVRRGAADAVAYWPQVKHAARLAQLDAAATAARRGMHGTCPGA